MIPLQSALTCEKKNGFEQRICEKVEKTHLNRKDVIRRCSTVRIQDGLDGNDTADPVVCSRDLSEIEKLSTNRSVDTVWVVIDVVRRELVLVVHVFGRADEISEDSDNKDHTAAETPSEDAESDATPTNASLRHPRLPQGLRCPPFTILWRRGKKGHPQTLRNRRKQNLEARACSVFAGGRIEDLSGSDRT